MPTKLKDAKVGIVSPILGVNYEDNPLEMDKRFATEMRNLRYSQGALAKRDGHTIVGVSLESDGKAHYPFQGGTVGTAQRTMFVNEWKKNDGNLYLVAADKDDLYQRSGTGWDYITRSYTTGKVTITSGSQYAYGTSGTAWTTTNCRTSDIFMCTSATNLHYKIANVISTCTMQLTTAWASTSVANLSYRVRNLNTGSDGNFYKAAIMNDTFYITNFADPVCQWTASGNASALTTTGLTTLRAKIVTNFFDHLMFLNYVENGTAYPNGILWSNINAPTVYNAGDYGSAVLDATSGKIMDIAYLGRTLYVFKEFGVDAIDYYGGAYVYRVEPRLRMGTPSERTAITTRIGIIFLGWDNVWLFTGTSTPIAIGNKVQKEIFSAIDQTYLSQTWARFTEGENVYELHVPVSAATPDRVFLYDIEKGRWLDDSQNFTCGDYGTRNAVTTWDDVTATWEATTVTWDSYLSSTVDRRASYGDINGYVYEVDPANNNDNTTEINGYFDTPDFTDIQTPVDNYLRCNGICFEASGNNLTVYYSTDAGATWTSIATQALTSSYATYKLHITVRARKIRFRFKNNTAGEDFSLRWYQPIYRSRSDR